MLFIMAILHYFPETGRVNITEVIINYLEAVQENITEPIII